MGVFVGLTAGLAPAQSPVDLQFLLDPNTSALGFSSGPSLFDESSSGRELPVLGGYAYFNATTVLGRELWRCQEAPGSAELVADIRVGPDSSEPRDHTIVGNLLYFTADDGVHGRELWVTDGTANGTQMVTDLVPGAGEPTFGSTASFLGELYFACDLGSGRHLYATDSTTGGVRLVVDVTNGTGDSQVDDLQTAPNGQRLVFEANDGVSGLEPWTTTGFQTTTSRLADLSPGADSTFLLLNGAVTLGNHIYYGASDSSNQPLICRTDGVTNEVVRTFPSTQFQRPVRVLFAFQNEVYFWATGAGVGQEVFRTDGTTSGTALWQDLSPGSASTVIWDAGVARDGSAFFLNADFDLVTFDGTSVVTVPGLSAFEFGGVGDVVICRLEQNQATGDEPYRIYPDGTVELLADFEPGEAGSFPRQFTAIGNSVLILADSPTFGGELYVTDGTAQGTGLHTDIEPRVQTGRLRLRTVASVGDRAFFGGNEASVGNELWITDGSVGGTQVLKDINPGVADSTPRNMVALGQDVLFEADDGVHGNELWFSDGTAIGTRLVKDIVPGSAGNFIESIAVLDRVAYISIDDGVHGTELWRCDGTTAGTFLLADIAPGATGSFPNQLTTAGRFVYFRANDGTNGSELWRTDGTAAGTILVADINTTTANSGGALIQWISPLRDGVAFIASAGSQQTVWTSDGHSVTEIASFADLGNRAADRLVTTDGGRVYVVTDSRSGGSRPRIGDLFLFENGQWTQLTSFPAPNDIFTIGAFGEMAIFDLAGAGLYSSDGTVSGTSLISSVEIDFSDFLAVGDILYFNGETAASGDELWRTDGTAAGTFLVQELFPGTEDSDPEDFFLVNGDLFFTADLPLQRETLNVLRRPGASAMPFGSSCGAPDRGLLASPAILGQNLVIDAQGPANSTLTAVFADPFVGTRVPLFDWELYVGLTALPILTANGPSGTTSVAVPNDMSLMDSNFVMQAAWFDAMGFFVTSRGLWMTIDDK